MKYVILLVSLMMFGCNGKEEAKSQALFQCIHPAIMGGMPFNLPANALFLNNGKVVFEAASQRFSLVGIVCIKVEGTTK